MKSLRYLVAFAVFALLCACGSDDTDKLDPRIRAERNALTAETEYGIYQNGEAGFVFNKTLHQYYANPSRNIYRIQTDAGTNYAELTLDAAPSASEGVAATLRQNVGLSPVTLDRVIVLKSDSERMWLWCDAAHTGFIVPRIEANS